MFLDHITPIETKTISKTPHYHFLLDGPAGNIEALLAVPENENIQQVIAVVCHPHPLFDGTMHNKVTYIIAKTFIDLGIPTLRFNFRGVELSEGEHDKGIGEQRDLLAAVEKMRQMFPSMNLWLGGFSFGAYISLSLCEQLSASRLINVAPPVTSFDFSLLTLPTCPWLLLQGLEDEVIDSQKVLDWARGLDSPPDIQTFPEVGHFFHRKLNAIKDTILNHVSA